MTDIKNYTVAMAHDRLIDFIKEVNSYINKGWEPIGSITVVDFNYGRSYLQPMIKREANND